MDSIYLKKVLSGDTDAFRYFVNTYKDYAFSISYSILKNEYLAEEAIQEAFIKAFENLETFRKDSLFKTWFGRIVINQSLSKTEKKSREFISYDKISETEIKSVEDTLRSILHKEQKHYITVVFELLPPKESLVLDLFYLKENSINDIVLLTGWSKSKIKMLLVRGRKSFYCKLKELVKAEIEEMI